MTMKKIIEFFKYAWKNILIRIIGMLMIAIGLNMVYYHSISNEFLLFFISIALVYCGSILLNKNVFHVTDTDKAMLAISYFTAYWNYKKNGVKPDIVPFTFEETNMELKTIRERVDEIFSQEN